MNKILKTYRKKDTHFKQRHHVHSLENWEWGLKIFSDMSTLTTHILYMYRLGLRDGNIHNNYA